MLCNPRSGAVSALSGSNAHPTNREAPFNPFTSMSKILIVDDEWLTRVEVAQMLSSLGYDVVGEASSGLESVGMARELKPDLVLMDVVLPGEMDGIKAAEKIWLELDIPIVFISGYGDEDYIQRAKEMEPFGYVMKPFDQREIRAFVEIALHKKKLESRLKQANAELILVNDQLTRTSREWEEIFQAIGQPALILDRDQIILNANRSALEATGRREQDLIGQKCYEIFHHSDGPPKGCPFKKMKTSGRLQIAEMEVECLARTFLISCTPMKDQQGRLEKAIHIATDLTEQKRLEAKVRQAQKMNAVATLAGGISHEFNNSLTAVAWHNNLIEMKYPGNGDIVRHLAGIDRAVRKMTRLTSQLLAYARGGKYMVKDLSLTALVREMLPSLQQRMDPNIQLTSDLAQDVCSISADDTQMQMVLSALVANAQEAIEGSGRICVSVRNMDLDTEFVGDRPGLKPGRNVCLAVEDTGMGMDRKTCKQIFDPFFTTHFFGRGLSMAAVYGIVKNHDGWIDVLSEPGVGTTVNIYIPPAPA